MAVKALGKGPEQGARLGLRVDDAVAVRRAQMRRRAGLRVVPPAGGPARNCAESPRIDFARRVVLGPSAAGAEAVNRAEVAEQNDSPEVPAAAPMSGVVGSAESDSMFEEAVEQARLIATPVRAEERRSGASAGEVRATRGAMVAAGEAAAQGAPSLAPRGAYRFTLRGQRVLVALGFAVSIAAGAIVGNLIGPPELPEETATMVVQSGDSLWSIASSLAEPGEDLGPVMSEIRELNGLETAYIASGQELVVPSN